MKTIPSFPYYPHENTVEWTALETALDDLEARGAIRPFVGKRLILFVLCRALERATAGRGVPA